MERNKKVLVYLDFVSMHYRRLGQVDEILRKYNNSTLVIGSDAGELAEMFKKNHTINIINIKDYIDAEFLENVDKDTLKFSRSMGNLKKNYLQFRNISLAEIIDNALYGKYFDTLQELYILDKLIRIEKPDMLLKYSDFTPCSREIKDVLMQKYKIKLEIINLNFKEVVSTKLKEAVVRLINLFSLFINLWSIRELLMYYYLCLTKAANNGTINNKNREMPANAAKLNSNIKPLFVLDNSNSSCIDTVLPLINRSDTKTIITNSLNLVMKGDLINHDEMIYLSSYNKSFINFKYIPYLFHLFDFKHELKKGFFRINGYDLSPLLLKSLNVIFLRDFPRIISSIIAIDKLIKKESYNFVILPSDSREFEEECVKVASNLKIPSLVVQHAIGGRTFGFIPINATKIALWGERDKLWFEANGADMNKVTVIGCPRFDSLINNSFDHNEILRKYDLPNKNIILVATTQMFAEYFKNYNLIIEIIKLLGFYDNIVFIIKPHPSEDVNKYKQMLIKLNVKNGIVMQSADLNELIFLSNFVITYPSTVPIHAMVLKKPFVLLGVSAIYSKYPELVNIIDAKEVNTKLKPLLSDKPFLLKPDFENVLKDFLYKSDGRATDRVIELVKEIYISA